MDRTTAPHHIDIGSGKRGFRDQNIAIGQIGTRVEAAFLNSVQEEILAVIEKAGLPPQAGDWTQLWQALQRLNAPGYQGRHNWHGVVSMTTTSPPSNAPGGAAYLIPANADGDWAGKTSQIAMRDIGNGGAGSGGWLYITPQDDHGIGLPDGSIYVREGGQYKLLRTLYQNFFDNRYSRMTAPPVDTFYVNGLIGNDANDGISTQWPFKTIQGAINTIASKYLTFAQVTIQVADGEYDGVTIPASLVQNWAFIGNPSDPASTVIKAQTLDINRGRAVTSRGNGVYFDGFELKSAYENFSINDATTTSIRNCILNIPTIANAFAVGAWGSRIAMHGTITVRGSGSSTVFIATDGGVMVVGYADAAGSDPCNIIYDDVVTYANFAAERGGSILFYPTVVSFSGTLTAKKFWVAYNGSIATSGAGIGWLPGDQAGTIATGGQVA